MKVKILSEAGYEEALFGLGLSHGVTSGLDFDRDFNSFYWPSDACDAAERQERMARVANRLAGKGNGHDKFLRQIMVFLDCNCPRYFWPELDQYKVATVSQSESTMHTIHKTPFTQDMFQDGDVPEEYLSYLNKLRDRFLITKDKDIWRKIIKHKPESFLQRRVLSCNYATLRNIIQQRNGHKLKEWAIFIDAIKSQCQNPELLP